VITAAQATQYLDQALGVTVPGFFVDAAVARVATAEAAMVAAGYTAEQQVLVQSMAVAIIASAGAPRRIQSQGAPSGASRSFFNDAKALTNLRRALAALDTAGTVAGLIGPDPSNGTLLFVTC
jgi:UDP-N-acetylmuramoylalanine-D-glutamate ligase